LQNNLKTYAKRLGYLSLYSYIHGEVKKKIKVMKKVLNYINNNLVELIAVRDTILLAGMIYLAAQACKFILLYFA